MSLGLTLLVPLVLSLFYRDGSWESFLIPVAADDPSGRGGPRVGPALPFQPGRDFVSSKDVYVAVTLA